LDTVDALTATDAPDRDQCVGRCRRRIVRL